MNIKFLCAKLQAVPHFGLQQDFWQTVCHWFLQAESKCWHSGFFSRSLYTCSAGTQIGFKNTSAVHVIQDTHFWLLLCVCYLTLYLSHFSSKLCLWGFRKMRVERWCQLFLPHILVRILLEESRIQHQINKSDYTGTERVIGLVTLGLTSLCNSVTSFACLVSRVSGSVE